MDGPTQGGAKLIAAKGRGNAVGEVVVCVEEAAKELIDRAVETVGTGTCDRGDGAAEVRPKSAVESQVTTENSWIASTPKVPPSAPPGPAPE